MTVEITSDADWQNIRRRLNHDWLRNKLIVAVGKSLNVVKGKYEDPKFDKMFLGRLLPEWESKRAVAEELALSVEAALSPRRWLGRPPLDHLPIDTRRWLEKVTHEVWMHQVPVAEWRDRVLHALRLADERYGELKELLSSDVLVGRPDVGYALAAFGQACEDLARAISATLSRGRIA